MSPVDPTYHQNHQDHHEEDYDSSIFTAITNIEWKLIPLSGKLKPLLHVNPIVVNDVTISVIYGASARNVINQRLGIGAILEIDISSSVIPIIRSILRSSDQIILPTVNYHWDIRQKHFIAIEDENLPLAPVHFF